MAADLPEQPTMTDIVRRRFETGEFGRAHFTVTPAMREHLLTLAPDPKPFAIPGTIGLTELLGIPLVVDESLPDGTWQLRDNSTGEVLFVGVDRG